MSLRPDIAWSRQLAGTPLSLMALWAFAGTMVIAAHGTAGWYVMQDRTAPLAETAEPAAIMIDLASVPMAPAALEEQIAADEVDSIAAEAVPVETMPAEVMEEAEIVEEIEPVEPLPMQEAEPVETVEASEPVDVEEVIEEALEPIDPIEEQVAALDPVELPRPQIRPEPPRKQEVKPEARQEKPRKKPEASKARQQPSAEKRRAQMVSQQNAPRAAAPQNSNGAVSSVSPARWQARLASHLERRKRYPAAARRQGQQGTAQVRFTIDASGNVQTVSLVRSSGVAMLDDEVMSLVRRASPVPAPPPGVNRTVVVPIRFSVR